MNLLTHLHLALQTWLRDLFSEEEILPEAAKRDQVDSLLADAQAALSSLRSDWAKAVVVQQRVESDWLAATAQVQVLDAAVNNDLRAGLERSARAKTVQLVALQDQVQQLDEQRSQAQVAVTRLQTASESLQRYLDEARRKRLALAERKQLVEFLLSLDRLDRVLTHNRKLLSNDLEAQTIAVQRQEDRLAAKEEWNRK